jgi:hypothetical protein
MMGDRRLNRAFLTTKYHKDMLVCPACFGKDFNVCRLEERSRIMLFRCIKCNTFMHRPGLNPFNWIPFLQGEVN